MVNLFAFQSFFRKFTGKEPRGHARVKGMHHHKEEYPFYKFMAVFTSGKGTSKFARELKSENPA